MKFLSVLAAFNRGLVSSLALARIDLKRMGLSAATFTNYVPRVLGSMMLRPGLAYIGATKSNAAAVFMDFVYATDDAALIELTNATMRVWINDALVSRPAVTSTFYRWNSGGSTWDTSADVSSGFGNSTDVGYWKDNDESGGTSALHTTAGYLALLGNGTAAAVRDRKVKVVETSTEHALNIVITQGTVTLRLGSTEGGDEYLTDRTLRVGNHSIAITPSGDFFIRLSSTDDTTSLVDIVSLNTAASAMEITTPWTSSDLDNIRWVQSGDVVFVACNGRIQKRIERQDRTNSPASRSWSVVDYAPEDGPFGDQNTGPTQIKTDVLSGDCTVTASRSLFKSTHVGALFRLASAGQTVSKRIQAQNTFSDYIKVTGSGTSSRQFNLNLTGPTFTGTTTVTLQKSVATPGTWVDQATYTAVQSVNVDDGLDNQIIYYRVGVKTGNYTALDDITATLTYSQGSIDGVVKITAVASTTSASGVILKAMGATNTYTSDWWEGDWSPRKGYPSAVELFDGRLWWAGKQNVWGSASNAFDSFDDTEEGDSATIKRDLGAGPVDQASWMMALNHLLIGTTGAIQVAKSSSIDEPLTPSKFSLKPVASIGAIAVRPIQIDTNGIFVGRNGSRVYQLSADANLYSVVPYAPTDLSAIIPEIGLSPFRRIGVQRFIDTRVHLVRTDGTVAILVFDKLENVTCWLEIETDGVVEDVVVLPGTGSAPLEDQVYYCVKRTINGSTKRYLEKWALESKARGGTDSRIADSHVIYSGAATTTITGLSHLEAKSVVVWADGVCPRNTDKTPKTYTVSGGSITLDTAASYVVAGLAYTGQWESAKLALGSQAQAPLTQFKKVDGVGLVAADLHPLGIQYGQDFDHMDYLPGREGGAAQNLDTILDEYDEPKLPVDGSWDTDARICLQSMAPRPATIMGIVLSGEGHDKL